MNLIPLVIVFLFGAFINLASADIKLGDFEDGEDGWALAGDSNTPKDRSMEIVEESGTSWLRLSYAPFMEDPDEYRGWAGLSRSWDNARQKGIKKLVFEISSEKPWKVEVLATFGDLGERGVAVFWPKDTVELSAKDFQVTPEQFQLMNGLRFTVDGDSATHGGGRNGQPSMWFQIANVRLEGGESNVARSATTEAVEKVVLSDWEDATFQGWKLVGDGLDGQGILVNDPANDRVFQLKVGEADAGSYGLALDYRSAQGKWAGLFFTAKDIKLTNSKELSFDIKNINNVRRVFVFITAGGVEYRANEVAVPANEGDDKWTHVVLAANGFLKSDGQAGAPDLNKLEAVRISFDGGQKFDPTKAEASFMIDNFCVDGKLADSAAVAKTIPVSPVDLPKWSGGSVIVGLLDADEFPMVGQVPGFIEAAEQALKASGASVERVAPQDLVATLAAKKVQLLVINGPAFPEGAASSVLDYLKAGGAVWFIGAQSILSKPMMQGADGKWVASDKEEDAPSDLRRILEGVQIQKGRFEFATREMQLTPEGKRWWPFLSGALPQVSCSFLAVDDSIDYLCTPPWVKAEPLAQVKYTKRNWVFQNDTFTGWPIVLFQHEGGPFKGARVLFSGISGGQDSILNPHQPAFGATVVSALSRLAEPVAQLSEKEWAPPSVIAQLPRPTRENYFNYPGPLFFPLTFAPPEIVADPIFWEDFKIAGFTSTFFGILWKAGERIPEDIVDWKGMDEFVQAAKANGTSVVFDPYSFAWVQYEGWTGVHSVYNTVFRERFAAAMKEIARRYKDEPTVIGLYATPSTHIAEFHVDPSPASRQVWAQYVQKNLNLSLEAAGQRYGVTLKSWDDLPLPEDVNSKPYNVSPLWADYLDFYITNYQAFIQTAIDAIRSETPEMPILLRGSYINSAINMSLASRNTKVAPHNECNETTVDVEGYYRGMGLRFGVPISAENGWPKARGGPLRMALAAFLMGNYNDFYYSFGGPTWMRPSLADFHQAEELTVRIRAAGAKYPNSDLALMIPDTTLYASRPASYLGIEKNPHIEFTMERLGYPFEAISPQFPKFDGLRIILDDGNNSVMTPAFRDQLAEWVRGGGTLLAYSTTGQYMMDGNAITLAGKLGVAFVCPANQGFKALPVGQGQVIVLPHVPNGDKVDDAKLLSKALDAAKAQRDVVADPDINIACLRGKEKSYLIFFNKSRKHVGAFFTESTLAKVEATLPKVTVSLTPGFKFKEAYDVVAGQKLTSVNGTFQVELPATYVGVVELTNAP